MKNLLYFSALSLCFISAHDSIAVDRFTRSEKSNQLFSRIDESQIITREEAQVLSERQDVHIRSEAIAIDDHAFRDNQDISSVTVNYDIKYIGEFSFANSSIESITLGGSLLRIRSYAFAGCQYLEEVIIPDTLQRIELNAFAGSGITYLSIPAKFMVYSENDYNGNLVIYMMPVNPSDGNWQTKIMTLAPGQELTVETRKGGLNQNVVTTFGGSSSSDSED